MGAIRDKFGRFFHKVARDQENGARESVFEELFNDMYVHRHRIYKMNFFRGIFFGLGSVIGGTLILAFLIWVLSLFGNIPVIGQFFQETQTTLQNPPSKQ